MPHGNAHLGRRLDGNPEPLLQEGLADELSQEPGAQGGLQLGLRLHRLLGDHPFLSHLPSSWRAAFNWSSNGTPVSMVSVARRISWVR